MNLSGTWSLESGSRVAIAIMAHNGKLVTETKLSGMGAGNSLRLVAQMGSEGDGFSYSKVR